MTIKFETRRSGFPLFGSPFAVICLMIILASSLLPAEGQGSDNPDQARNYCVSMGYLYRQSPSVNDGQPICQFQDNSWCDCQDFYGKKCSYLYASRNPNFYNIAQSDRVAAATRYCQDSGGRVESVHTPYGDVDLCAFPDGRSVNLWALYNRAGGDPWRYYAYSWLNAP